MAEGRSATMLSSAVVSVGVVVATTIGGWFFVKGKRGDQAITVTGSAHKRIKSDLVIWRAGVSYQGSQPQDAYKSLTEGISRIKQYLISKGIPEQQITISSISSTTLHPKDNDGNETSEIS